MGTHTHTHTHRHTHTEGNKYIERVSILSDGLYFSKGRSFDGPNGRPNELVEQLVDQVVDQVNQVEKKKKSKKIFFDQFFLTRSRPGRYQDIWSRPGCDQDIWSRSGRDLVKEKHFLIIFYFF